MAGQYPKATMREIELALDEHFAARRARMLQDMAMQCGCRAVALSAQAKV